MLMTRLFEPKHDEILYHYCSAPTFRAIVETGQLRFSDINMLNDAEEMRWGYGVFEEAAGNMLRLAEKNPKLKALDRNFLDKVDEIIAPMQFFVQPFVSCFSRAPDLLSQWRAYADDGRGFALGFNAQAMKQMPATLLAVEYDRAQQVQEMMAALGACFLENEDDGRKFGAKFKESCQLIGSFMAGFKNPGFEEEKEVRSIHLVQVIIEEKLMKLVDEGGFRGEAEVKGEEVRFRVCDGALIAYLDIPFKQGFTGQPITEVILGPKNPNGPGNVLYLLGQYGYESVRLRQSACAYR